MCFYGSTSRSVQGEDISLGLAGVRPLVFGQDRSETKKSVLDLERRTCVFLGLGLGLAGLVLCCERQSCHDRRHSDLEGHNNFSSTIYSFSILCLEHHFCGDQQWCSLI